MNKNNVVAISVVTSLNNDVNDPFMLITEVSLIIIINYMAPGYKGHTGLWVSQQINRQYF